jgi:uncharacterized protein DUF2721
MELHSLQFITSALAPVVMVSASGLLFNGIQTKHLHSADRLRALITEYRGLGEDVSHRERRKQIIKQVGLFRRRMWLSQHALEFIYMAVVCFVITSLFLASETFMLGVITPHLTAAMFILGVAFLLLALLFEFLELRTGLQTIGIEIAGAFEEP